MTNHDRLPANNKPARPEAVMSVRTAAGVLLEMILRSQASETALVMYSDGRISEHRSVTLDGKEYVPYSPTNNLLTHRVVVLPSAVANYDTDASLVEEVRAFIHRYVHLSDAFEEVAAYYVLMTWCYDQFNEVPYLRVRGDYGTGKSRFLLTVGSLCFKPIFASGASTVSPIFRLIDQIGGTLVIDEADFWASDERAEITKILNNGSARGFPVLRSDVTPNKEFNPRAFNIFGPKLVATRHPFEDAALESRCLTEVMGGQSLREDIPISLPQSFDTEAQEIRNKLLLYRFRRFANPVATLTGEGLRLEPRREQILAPLLFIAPSADVRSRLRAFVAGRPDGQERERDTIRQLLLSVRALLAFSPRTLTLADVTTRFQNDWGSSQGIEVANRAVGSILRRLGVQLRKSNGVYMIPSQEYQLLRRLFIDYRLAITQGIRERGDDTAAATALA